jgi:anthranilate/para-aminobenzoate synthase component I
LGGGFTKDSIVDDEWEETERKSKTLLSVIQDVK